MNKRTIGVLAALLFAFSGITAKLYELNSDETLSVAENQSTVKVTVATARGTIYDSNLQPLTNRGSHYAVSAIAAPQALAALSHSFSTDEWETLQSELQGGKPVIFTAKSPLSPTMGIQQFTTPVRYEETQLAPHVVGYVGDDGHGVTGAELVFDTELSEAAGSITVTYRTDARGNVTEPQPLSVKNTLFRAKAGVALTLDSRMQSMVETVAQSRLSKGAVVVMEPQTGNILAMVSVPSFSPLNIQKYLTAEDTPLFNRATAAYNCGSVFKTVSVMAALEAGVPTDRHFLCNGMLKVGSNRIKCHQTLGHGSLTMFDGYAQSCNPYFIQLIQETGGEVLYRMACLLGFDSPLLPAVNFATARAVFPSLEELSQPTVLANISFGQGDLLATPLHIAQMTACIVNGGEIRRSNLYAGTVDMLGRLTPAEIDPPTPVCSKQTAEIIKDMMIQVVNDGTGSSAMPKVGGAGGKTGTAETGWVGKDGKTMVQNWFTGFYPAVSPRYVITVLAEDSGRTREAAAPVFADVCNYLYRMGYLEENT